MKDIQRILSVCIAAAMIASAVPPVLAEDVNGNGTAVHSYSVEGNAAEVNGSVYESLQAAIDAANSGDTITLLRDIDITNTINITKNLTIVASDSVDQVVIKRTNSILVQMFDVSGGAILTFGGSGSTLIVDGGAIWGDDGNSGIRATWPIIRVQNGKFYLQENAVLQNNQNTSGDGGAIAATGGGNATIYIYGTIRNNEAKLSGGAIMANCYTNIFETARIENNKAYNNGGGVYNYSGGVANIEGGTFSSNSAANGGAVWCDGKTEIRKGLYTENSATNGSAVYANSSSSGRAVTISGGTFTGNSDSANGDIYVNTSYLYLKGDFTADTIYVPKGKEANISGALTGSFKVDTGDDIYSCPVVLRGSSYNITENDMAAISAQNKVAEAVLDSNTVYLKYPLINISKQPQNVEVFMGNGAELSFTAEKRDGFGEFSYTWYSCDADGSNEIKISETDTPEYVPDTSTPGNKYYFCEIKADNAEITRTNIVRVKVMNPDVAEAPEFIVQPEDTGFSYGDTVTITAQAKLFDNGTLSYKWYKSSDGTQNPETDEVVAGAVTGELVFTPDTEKDTYFYCVATNTIGESVVSTLSRVAKVSCDSNVTIIGAPQTGSTVTAEYKNITAQNLNFKWQISDSAEGVFTDIDGANDSSFTFSSEHEGKYVRAVISSGNALIVSVAKSVKPAGTYNEYSGDYIYLSDLPKSQLVYSKVGYKDLEFDKNTSKDTISLVVGGKKKYFTKGLGAHAEATLIYDVEELTDNYKFTRFTSYLGLDSAQGSNGNGVKFVLSVSDNMEDWTPVKETGTLKGDSEAEYVTIDLSGVKYFKIYIDKLGNESRDHSVIAGAKLSRVDYEEDTADYDWIKTVDAYDSEIEQYEAEHPGSYSQLIENKDYRTLIYKRNFVKNVTYDYLQAFAHTDENKKAAMFWFMNDEEALEMYTQGGYPTGSYMNSVKVLTDLYTRHKDDLSDGEFGTLYKRMMITLSLTHSANVTFWADSTVVSNPVRRYEIYKKLHDNDLLLNSVFENLNVEEMRWVMGDLMDDDEIEWLNYYSRKTSKTAESDYKTSNFTMGPYHYIKYTSGFNYYQDKYYNEANKEQWQSKYFLTQEYANDDRFEINIPYDYNHPKLWTVFAEGAVCGGISKTGTNLLTVFGVPGVVIGQPGHAAYLRYIYSDESVEDSPATWTIWNDISGWTGSEKGERLLCGWGSKSWDSAYQVSYVLLAQAALNDEENYNKALALVRTADTKTDPQEKIDIYEEVLSIQNINLDAWEGMIYAYNSMGKTEDDYIELARRIADAYTYYPLPMWDMLENLIKPHLTSEIKRSELLIYQQTALKKASVAGAGSTLQPGPCQTMANHLLGNKSVDLATFSFDGANANKIILSNEFAGGGNELLYSLNGNSADAWVNAGNVSEVELSPEQIDSITVDNDILVRLQGTSNYYTIDITQANAPSGILVNDNENALINATDKMEWSTDGNNWFKMTNTQRFPGEMTVQLRTAATGTKKRSEATTYNFNTDTSTPDRQYITILDLSIAGCSSAQSGGEAVKAIDGNKNTMWHTVWSGTDTERSISIKTETPRYLSAVEYTPRASGTNGIFTTCEIYTSLNGTQWDLVDTVNWKGNNTKKIYDFETPVYAQYIKLVGKQAVGNFGSAAMIELYEDTTVVDKTISSLEIESLPSKLSYLKGESLDLTGLVVKAVYRDGSSEYIANEELGISPHIFENEGEETVTLSYNGIETSFNVSVAAPSENTGYFSDISFDSGYYWDESSKKGIIRFFAKPLVENITRQGFVYYDSSSDRNGKEVAYDVTETENKGFYIDVFDIPEDFGEVTVKAFVVTGGEKVFSDVISGKVDWNREIEFE